MKLYREKLSRFVPVLETKREQIPNSGLTMKCTEMPFLPEGDFYEMLPYLQEVQELADSSGMSEGKRIFIVTEEEMIALKVAHGYVAYPVYEAFDEVYEKLEKEEKEDLYRSGPCEPCAEKGVSKGIRVISMHGEKRKETENNPFLLMTAGVEEGQAVFFCGLEESGSLSDKLETIMVCKAERQFVQVTEEQLGRTWFRELMMDRECEILQIAKVSNAYYEEVLNRLLEGERYRLEETITPAWLVRNIRKRCGNRFSEDDLAWSLDQAAKRAKKACRRMLQVEDFNLERESAGSSLQLLEKMTGLENMKKLAAEYAALSREQAKNEKIAELCRHVIYVGNPGSGKTMCGELLAKILAEEGQSNGNFVVATRKDIIGEYVGHTAPKVAELFRQARYGVLFVDEAGFFLKGSERDFIGEAIKEFVRYMELYRDVVVIFAMYASEVERWMELDAGLASRIGRIVRFEDYSSEELVQIGMSMCRDSGYRMEEGAVEEIIPYISACRQKQKEKFGNAREIRKLVEAAIMAKSIRCFKLVDQETEAVLRREDFAAAIQEIGREIEKAEKKQMIGFAVGGL